MLAACAQRLARVGEYLIVSIRRKAMCRLISSALTPTDKPSVVRPHDTSVAAIRTLVSGAARLVAINCPRDMAKENAATSPKRPQRPLRCLSGRFWFNEDSS